ncbi:MAG: hypothetical protein IPO81_18895 [Kouleothrix sp.]|nr:hypothetical protein [Kouleothrix sp.]
MRCRLGCRRAAQDAGGLLDVRVALSRQMIKPAFIGGDFFARAENAVADLEAPALAHRRPRR